MNWIDVKITPDEMSLIICVGYDRVHRGFYSNGSYWSADGRLRKLNPRKWIYEKDLVIDSFLT